MNKKVRIKEKMFKNGTIEFIPQFRLFYIWFDFLPLVFSVKNYKHFGIKHECNRFLKNYLAQSEYVKTIKPIKPKTIYHEIE